MHHDQLPPVGAGATPFRWEITTGRARGPEKFFWNFPLWRTWFFHLVFLTSQGLCKRYKQCKGIKCSPEWGNSTHEKRILVFKNFCLRFCVFVKITLFAKIVGFTSSYFKVGGVLKNLGPEQHFSSIFGGMLCYRVMRFWKMKIFWPCLRLFGALWGIWQKNVITLTHVIFESCLLGQVFNAFCK